MHENLDVIKDLDVNPYIISGDTPEEHIQLYSALKDKYGESIPFVSDPNLEVIEMFNMKNGDVAYRGYGLLDTDGTVVFNTVNDNWGEQFNETIEKINKEYERITNN